MKRAVVCLLILFFSTKQILAGNPIHKAINDANKTLDQIKAIIDNNKGQINTIDDGFLPLNETIARIPLAKKPEKWKEISRYLLENGANPNLNAMTKLLETNDLDLIKLASEKGGTLSNDMRIFNIKDLEFLKQLVENNLIDINSHAGDGLTLLNMIITQPNRYGGKAKATKILDYLLSLPSLDQRISFSESNSLAMCVKGYVYDFAKKFLFTPNPHVNGTDEYKKNVLMLIFEGYVHFGRFGTPPTDKEKKENERKLFQLLKITLTYADKINFEHKDTYGNKITNYFQSTVEGAWENKPPQKWINLVKRAMDPASRPELIAHLKKEFPGIKTGKKGDSGKYSTIQNLMTTLNQLNLKLKALSTKLNVLEQQS